MDLSLTFLGTSAGTPTRSRNVTAQLLTLPHGGAWLLDCGEGTQQQFLRFGLRASRVERILLTHLHGDHCYGIWGMLAKIAIDGRTEPVEVVGPHGIAELLTTVHRISAAFLTYPLRVIELDAEPDLLPLAGWSVQAIPIVHRVPCFAYVLREDERPGRFHPDRAIALGVRPGPDFGRLQRGGSVAGVTGPVHPDQVQDPPRPGRVIALLGDTSDATSIIPHASGCDLLVCEATYDGTRAAKAKEWGHQTAPETGRLARMCEAKRLIITHVSSRYGDDEDDGDAAVDALRDEAAAECPGTDVLAAHDGFVVRL